VSFKSDKVYVQSQLIVAHGTKILKPIYFLRQITNKHYKRSCRSELVKIHQCNQTFVIDATVPPIISITQFVSQKCKDAIVDQFRERTGQRPSIDKVHPDLRINIHIDRDQVSVALDTSGNSLHQRGYRTELILRQ
jgi:putative N6-adenine-specific DNA methylase